MNSDVRDLFKELEPPPGGAERFAARLDAEMAAAPAVRRRRALSAGAACAALALVVSLVWLRQPNDPPQLASGATEPPVDVYNAPELDRLLGRPLRTTELTVVAGTETLSVTRLDTANEKVRLYRIDEPAPAPPP